MYVYVHRDEFGRRVAHVADDASTILHVALPRPPESGFKLEDCKVDELVDHRDFRDAGPAAGDGWVVRRPDGSWPSQPNPGQPVEAYCVEVATDGQVQTLKTRMCLSGVPPAYLSMYVGLRPACLAWRPLDPGFAKLPVAWLWEGKPGKGTAAG